MPNFSIALSGLQADTTALNTIAGNLSNMSTTAYKAKSTGFSDMFYQSLGANGANDPLVVGTGTKVASTSTDYTQGSYDTTGKSSSDMALDGQGFFVVSEGATNYLTRDGSFTADTSGHLATSSGKVLMGYAASNGAVTSTTLSPITLPTKGSVINATASTEFTITANLDSAASTNSTFSSTATVYDSLGTSHNVTVTYTKTGNNTWDYSINLPSSDFASGTGTPTTGTLNFDTNGSLISVTSGGSTSTVGTAVGDISSVPVSFSGLADGASNLSMNWNLLSSSKGKIMTQVDSDSTTAYIADGYAAGAYQSFTVDANGDVQATYSNGKTLLVGQVAVADVANQQGLSQLGNGLYKATTASGAINIGIAGSGGMGAVKDSALESSNVDISTQFSQLIIAQRAFQANSKSITTFDSVTQDAIGLIR